MYSYLQAVRIPVLSGCNTLRVLITLLLICLSCSAALAAPFDESKALLEKGFYPQAITLLKKELNRSSLKPNVKAKGQFLLAMAYAGNRQWSLAEEEAMSALQQLQNQNDIAANLFSLLGTIHEGLNHQDLAIEAYIMAIQVDPNPSSERFMTLAEAFQRNRQLELALDCLQQGIQYFKLDHGLHNLALSLEIKLMRYPSALVRTQYLIKQGQRPIHWYLRQGEVHQKQRNFEAATASYKQAKALYLALPTQQKASSYMKLLGQTINQRIQIASSF